MKNKVDSIWDTIWTGGITSLVTVLEQLTQEQMAELFQKAKSTINEHIQNIYADGELKLEETMRKFGNSEFSTKPTNYYNLDMIISVGYRVKSQRVVQFRIWASSILKEYLKKGFAMDDERLY
ncbi:MAG: virulence RhuM family protein [Lachnospiraceae bacterium]|nr:virulence RhuM family protein [Lachnospiraceae bacterium]